MDFLLSEPTTLYADFRENYPILHKEGIVGIVGDLLNILSSNIYITVAFGVSLS